MCVYVDKIYVSVFLVGKVEILVEIGKRELKSKDDVSLFNDWVEMVAISPPFSLVLLASLIKGIFFLFSSSSRSFSMT